MEAPLPAPEVNQRHPCPPSTIHITHAGNGFLLQVRSVEDSLTEKSPRLSFT